MKKKQQKKIKLPQLTWIGFNYVLGLGFLITIFSVFNKTGLHSIWILALTSLVVFGCGIAFMRNATIYSDVNGGASEYNNRTFGSFMGWAVGFLQWILGPIAASINILLLLEFSLRGSGIEKIWGEFTTLYFRLISIAVFILLWTIVIIGINQFKLAINIVSVIKWMLMLTVIVSTIVIIVRSSGGNFKNVLKYGDLTIANFNASFLLFLYGFGGFESFAVMSKNVENPKHAMPRAILISIVGAAIFYMIAIILILGSLPAKIEDNENPINYLVGLAFGSWALALPVLAQIFSRLTTDLQNPLYIGSYFQGLSEQKYLPKYFQKISQKSNVPRRAIVFNLIIILIVAFILLILPLFTNFKAQNLQDNIKIYAIVTLLVYLSVIGSALKLHFFKIIKLRWWELALLLISFVFLSIQVIVYFYQFQENKYGIIILAIASVFILIWYFTFVKKNKKNLRASNLVKK